jgi:uncharacterized membrane-anchored protein
MEEVMKMDEIMKRYFTEEQLAALAQRHEQAGDQTAARVMAEWPQLIASLEKETEPLLYKAGNGSSFHMLRSWEAYSLRS